MSLHTTIPRHTAERTNKQRIADCAPSSPIGRSRGVSLRTTTPVSVTNKQSIVPPLTVKCVV